MGEVAESDVEAAEFDGLPRLTGRGGKGNGRRLVKPAEASAPLTAQQRLLLLDTWQRSGLPAGDFAPLVGVSKHTLYLWKKKFEAEGPAGLMDQPRGAPKGRKLSEITKRAHDPHAQGVEPRVGLSADQRHAAGLASWSRVKPR